MTTPAKILIVDDIEANRNILNHLTITLGHTPMLAENGLSALAQISKQPPDLILLDILMSEMDGYQVLEHLKSKNHLRHIPVIMISAVDEIDSVVKCIEQGADDYLVKPLNPTLLRARINSSLEKKQWRDKLQKSEEKYSNLFHHSNDSIFVHDLEGNFIDANQKALDLFGYTKSEILSLKIPDLHSPKEYERARQASHHLFENGVAQFEATFKKKNGEEFPAEISASVFEIAGEEVIQGIVRDITERKQAEEELHFKNTILSTQQDRNSPRRKSGLNFD